MLTVNYKNSLVLYIYKKNLGLWINHIALPHIDGLVQERHNSIANALELRLSSTNLLIYNLAHNMTSPLLWYDE